MSCRHDLALGTCKRCYPKTGTIEPGPEEDYEPNLEGPGAIIGAPSRTTPDGSTLRVLGDPPAEPVLQICKEGRLSHAAVLRADDRAWLREQLARFDAQTQPEVEWDKQAALARLAAIADAFDDNGLDEARPEWKGWNHPEPEKVVLLSGRGGRTLLTLADAFAAREALRGK